MALNPRDMTNDALQSEWRHWCTIHDRGIDSLPMGHPTIENAAMKLRDVEREIYRRGLRIEGFQND